MRPSGELVLALLLAVASVAASRSAGGGGAQGPPAAQLDPAEYAARDAHEGVTLAAKLYLQAAELKARFGTHPLLAAGIVAVEILIVNERAESVRVAWARAVLLSGEEKFEQIEPERIAWQLYPPPKIRSKRPWPEQSKRLPRDKQRTAREGLEAALRSQRMRLAVIPAGGRARGFLYFDPGTLPLELARARLYLPEVVRLPGEEPLLFFEVELKAPEASGPSTEGCLVEGFEESRQPCQSHYVIP
ncbi:MAG: hypothetical protein ACE5H2_06920 [Terriglobia bacterium]